MSGDWDGSFHAVGSTIRRRPKRTPQADGKSNISLGYTVCVMHDDCRDGAEELARILTAHDDMVEALKPFAAEAGEYCSGDSYPVDGYGALNVGHLRRAAAAYRKATGGE